MSIEPILDKLMCDKKLFELESLLTGSEIVRTMVVSSDIAAAVTPPFPDTEEGLRLGEFRRWLDAFMEGCELSVAEDPFRKPADAMLARTAPVEDEFWSIRVTEPDDTAGLRSLGGFFGLDKFRALTWEYREAICDFDDQVNLVRDAWRNLFGTEKPLRGDSLDEYLTNYRAV
jgi:hypothetical protein